MILCCKRLKLGNIAKIGFRLAPFCKALFRVLFCIAKICIVSISTINPGLCSLVHDFGLINHFYYKKLYVFGMYMILAVKN